MKGVLIGLLALLSLSINAQHMKNPNEVVTNLFVATDLQNWTEVKQCFAPKVLLDYSSMNANPASEFSPDQIVSAWQGILPGFASTHHQLGNFITTLRDDRAEVFCYGTAYHYLTDEGGNLWTVVGTYDFELMKDADDRWAISAMKFNFKFQDGNTALPEKAINSLKN